MIVLYLPSISSQNSSHPIVRCFCPACGSPKGNSLQRIWTPAHAGEEDAEEDAVGLTETTTDETDLPVDLIRHTEMDVGMETLMDTRLIPRRTHTSHGIRTPRLRADLVA